MSHLGSTKFDLFEWTDARKEELRALWDEGLTAEQIGQRMHATRNSVIGKVKRMKLPQRRPKPSAPVKLVDLAFYHCRWPLYGDTDGAATGFPHCGRMKEPGKAYCAGHAAMAFQGKKKEAVG